MLFLPYEVRISERNNLRLAERSVNVRRGAQAFNVDIEMEMGEGALLAQWQSNCRRPDKAYHGEYDIAFGKIADRKPKWPTKFTTTEYTAAQTSIFPGKFGAGEGI